MIGKNANEILGIHHITALARDPQRNVDFYTEALGLRLVKRTVNFDDPGDAIIDDWPPRTFADLAVQHIQVLLNLEPEIILLGTGSSLRFPDNDILQPVYSGHIGLEIMDTGAACRAYNFLSAEGRKVIAALLQIAAE